MIYNLNSRASVKAVIEDLENLETACFMHKYENDFLPSAFLNFFEANPQILE